jgi:UTP--glucose-1-phosphate uridylyltransferase
MSAPGLEACVQKMRDAGVADVAIDTFAELYERLAAGETGLIPESEIEPVESVPDFEALPDADADELLDQAVVIKLNGGLGTSMGMTRAKSLLEARAGETFLDLIARQVLALRERSGARVPLVLMNSFATRDESLAALEGHSELSADLPADFLQSKEPKLLAEDLTPVSWPANPELEWCPPGHGDLFTSLQTSGVLAAMLDRGYRWAFVSSSDNLAAVLDPRILAWIAREGAPFVMEVADRTPADRKGGHIAQRRSGGGLLLREIAQTPDSDVDAFQDISRYRYFNTNTIWFDLHAIGDLPPLPLIRNVKTVDPSDKSSPEVVQIETAMGAALGVIDGARALRVPRDRFSPVKTTNDLLALRSDAYEVGSDGRVALVAERNGSPPDVDLDPEHFKLVADFEPRVAAGAPSLREAERLVVRGDVTFGADIVIRGDVEIEAEDGPTRIEDGTVLEG